MGQAHVYDAGAVACCRLCGREVDEEGLKRKTKRTKTKTKRMTKTKREGKLWVGWEEVMMMRRRRWM